MRGIYVISMVYQKRDKTFNCTDSEFDDKDHAVQVARRLKPGKPVSDADAEKMGCTPGSVPITVSLNHVVRERVEF